MYTYDSYKEFNSPYTDLRTQVPDPTYFKDKTSEVNGTLQNLNFQYVRQIDDGAGIMDPVTFSDDQDLYPGHTALRAQGYFLAQHAGRYNFLVDGPNTDDWAFLWLGDKAYHGYDYDNKDGEAWGRRFVPSQGINVSIDVEQGQLVPLTYLWLNYGGEAISNFRVATGDLISHLPGWFIWDCDENAFT